MNQVLPLWIVAVAIAALAGVWRRSDHVVAPTVWFFPGLHLGLAVAWRVVFAVTGGRVALLAGVTAAVLAACAIAVLGRTRGRWSIAGALFGLLVGVGLARSQRGADPATHPAEPVRVLTTPLAGELPSWAQAGPQGVRAVRGGITLEVSPLLSFWSRSPDRGWAIFAEQRTGDDVRASFGASMTPGGGLHIDAETVLAEEVYSHLNAFTLIQIRGHRRLFVAFSAMPDQRIEITYSEYPTGKPSRFAYLDEDSDLHAVESSTGEKGPFTELARGHLSPGSPLGLTLYDEDRRIATLELADFAAQASTQLSPTAGWGVPENAIELSLASDRPDADAMIFVTLAGTSVGRGWDSVGHAAGLYRNRIDLRD